MTPDVDNDGLPDALAAVRAYLAELDAYRSAVLRCEPWATVRDRKDGLRVRQDVALADGAAESLRAAVRRLPGWDETVWWPSERKLWKSLLYRERADPDESCADRAVRCFELFELLREAIINGSGPSRELGLRAVASNWTVEGGKLVPKLRSPFRQRAEQGGHPRWLPGLYDVRTEVAETLFLLEQAFEAMTQAKLLAAAQV